MGGIELQKKQVIPFINLFINYKNKNKMRISTDYFQQQDVLFLAKDLLGKSIFTNMDGQISGGIIVETEAYKGTTDKASHAYGGRRTKRNEIMYAEGGVIYVYLCYGIHHLLNIVTGSKDIPDAILIRSILSTHGEELMLKRRGKTRMTPDLTCGPGNVSKALGIGIKENGISLSGDKIWLEDRGVIFPETNIKATPRIGVEYAQEDASLPYRFCNVSYIKQLKSHELQSFRSFSRQYRSVAR